MIWIVFLIIGLSLCLYLAPSFLERATVETDQEVESYFAQIDALKDRDDLSEDEVVATTRRLERQILKRRDLSEAPPSRTLAFFIFAITLAGGAGLYALVGQPKYAAQPSASQMPQSPPSQLADILVQLEARTEGDLANDPQAFVYYAQALVGARRFDEALTAYDRAVELSENDPEIVSERDRLRLAINRGTPGPSAADIEAADALSEEDRGAMITAMVEGLSARLADDPNDPQGWVRLLRARKVLGQEAVAKAELSRLREAYADQPEIIEQILTAAAWSPTAPSDESP